MTRRHFLTSAGVALSSQIARPATRPNIAFIIADDLGWGDVGCYGNKEIPTPNIDRLAKQGVRLTNGYVSAAVCSPSRAGFMTGRYQARFGHDFNPAGRRASPEAALPKNELTIAERLRGQGYKTGLMGKWHLGEQDGFDPLSRGFDEYWGFAEAATFIAKPQPGDELFHLPEEDARPARRRLLIRGRERYEEDGYLTEIVTRESLAFLDRHRADPFFLVVAHHAPHVPLEATKQYVDRVSHISDKARRIYAAMIVALDDAVGAVLKKLDEMKVADHTFVAFFSDNGCPPYLPANVCSNGPFAGHKRDQLEGGIRVPTILRYSGVLKTGVDYSAPAISLDLMATALNIGGADLKAPPALDGVDLMPFLTGKAKGNPHQRLFWRAGETFAVHDGDWKLWRVASPAGGFAEFLFDLKNDPREQKNLASARPDIAQRLKEIYEAWNRANAAPGYKGRTSDVEILGVPVRLTF